ncbi:hypothetical protein SAMN04488030_0432 [Aliiroseovarius halocynthiae]|uniref:Uncharacterized protein n=1 Tax=Aliiroseovarius halocynthiae TaxID=985055 RepID=A0A545STY5_9RHOB|nr:DUF5360 family protein [Aliiroseovarius halocynthiae]TQV68425.1 hypothetical protein FIL88_02200 [Aliiroseovarius halocynthiae]SMR70819.1 hypothetical protein SAMN04488030_0432 [Aliiroseovarius halocynthiae]
MLRHLTTLTEILMASYWLFAFLLAFGLISIDPSLMYSDYENPRVVAWNWSFFPIDIAFVLLGLTATFADLKPALRERLSAIAATLMLCAGGMAISYWVMTQEFDVTWWAVNLWLIVLGILNLTCPTRVGGKTALSSPA